MSRDLKELHG